MTTSEASLLAELHEAVGHRAQMGAWEFDPTTGRGTWTLEVARIHEVAFDDPTSMSTGLSFYRDESRKRIAQAIHAAVEEAVSYDLELDLVTPSGVCKRIRAIGHPMVRDGRVHVRGTFQDITEIDRAHVESRCGEVLRRSEERFRAIFEHAPLGVVECDIRSGRVLRSNAKLCDIFGRSAAEMLGLCWADLTHPDDLTQVGAERLGVTREKRVVRPDGEIRWVRLTSTRIEAAGMPTSLAIVEDITERILAETRVHLRTTALHVGNGIAITDRAGRSNAASSMTGSAPDHLFPWGGGELLRTILGGNIWHGEQTTQRTDGTTYTEEQTVTPVFGHDGEVTHFVAVKQDVTERRRTEQQLRSELEVLQTALDALPTPFALASSDGRRVFSNRAYLDTFGYTLADAPTIERAMELFYPDPVIRAHTVAQWEAHRAEVEKTGIVTPVRTAPVRCKDGRVRDVQFAIRPLGGFLLAILDDVTERVSSAAALRETDERLRLTLDAADLATWRYDYDTGLFEFDVRAQALLALPAVLPFTEVAARLSPDHSITRDDYTALAAPGISRKVRRITLPNGEERWISALTKTFFNDTDHPSRPRFATVVAYDITQERRAEEALRLSEERYRTLVDSLDDVIFSLDEAGHITFVNMAVRSFGFTPEQCLGRAFTDFVHPDDREVARERNHQRMSGELVGAVEYRLRDGEGKTRFVRITTRPTAGGLAGILVDITKVRDTEEQLRAAQRMEAVGQLAGGVAHDFNNLLTVILSYAELCTTDLHAKDPLHSSIDEITQAANRAATLTRQLLAFSRRQVLQPELVELGELVTGLGKMLKRLIGEDIDLAVILSDKPCTTMVDRGQLEQVVMNLVVNARDAMPDGGRLTIAHDTITLDKEAAIPLEITAGRYARLAVSDTGTGMDEAVRARIFEPFFTTKEVGKGTGLGLSTVYGIVKQSRGHIAVESTPGTGSTFLIYLPAVDVVVASKPLPTTCSTHGHETLLVVEDEAPVRTAVVRALSRAGYKVLVAALPSEALALATAHGSSIAVVLTDVVMPEMNGRELANRLRPLCPNARILFTSGYTDDALLRRGVGEGEEFLSKPFEPKTLASRIRSLLDGGADLSSRP